MIGAIVELFSCALNTFIALCFASYFNGAKIKYNQKFRIFAVVLFFVNCIMNLFFRGYLSLAIYLPLSYMLNLLGLLSYSFLSQKSVSTVRKFIPVFVYQVSFIFANICSSIITSAVCRHSLMTSFYGFEEDRIIFLLINNLIISMLFLLAAFVYKKANKNQHSSKTYYLLLLLPVISAFTSFLYPVIGETVFSNHALSIFVIATILTTSLSAVGIYYLIYRMWLNNRVEKEKELYENMLKFEAKRYEDIISSSNKIRKIRHDIKNMLYSLKAEIDENNIGEAQRELNEILNNVNSIDSVIESGNRTIDYIVNAKLGNIENRTVAVSGDISGMSRLKDVDISIILGNILDNAVEATAGIKSAAISLSFFIKGNYQNILCKNTISGSILQNNPELMTVKNEKDTHGIGIKSVKEVVESYEGSMEIFEESNMFCVHIMMPMQ